MISALDKYINNYIWIVCLSFFVLLPFSSFYNIPLIILALAGIICLFNKSYSSDLKKRIKIYGLLFACIFIPMVLSFPDSVNQKETLRKIATFAAYFFTGLAVLYGLKNTVKSGYFLWGTGFLMLFWIIDALYQCTTGSNFLGYSHDFSQLTTGGGRLTGIFYPDFRIGIVLAILSPFYFEFIRLSQEKFILAWLIIVPFVFVVLLAGSRTSWFMLILSAILYVIYYYRSGYYKQFRLRALIPGIAVILACTMVISSTNLVNIDNIESFLISRISTAQYDPSDRTAPNALEQRVELWESAIRVIKENWINGIGVRGYRYLDKHKDIDSKPVVISENTRLSTHPHQITLEILLETGVIGLFGYILFWIILIRFYLPIIKNGEQQSDFLWLIPVVVAVFPLNMHKSFYGHFSASIIWLLVSMAIANFSLLQKKDQTYY